MEDKMDALTRFEYQTKAVFADIAFEVMANGDTYHFKEAAKDENVKDTSQIFALDEYRARHILPYVVKYGYENVNAFVREMIARMPQDVDE